jgi:hypothetical protein
MGKGEKGGRGNPIAQARSPPERGRGKERGEQKLYDTYETGNERAKGNKKGAWNETKATMRAFGKGFGTEFHNFIFCMHSSRVGAALLLGDIEI